MLTAVLAGSIGTTVNAQETISEIEEQAVSENTVQLDITVKYGQTESRSMLDMINEFRTGNDAWYWNNNDTQQYRPGNLSELTYDYNLEQIAMQRAAEIALSFLHTRPNSTDSSSTWDLTYNGVSSYGENITSYQSIPACNQMIHVYNSYCE